MASIVLSSLAATAGSFLGGGPLAMAGRLVGAGAGRFIDNKLFGSIHSSSSSGPRLKDLSVQTSTYGSIIPIIFGVVRTAGNIIWARPLSEKATTTAHRGGAKGARVRHSHTQYSYFASFAISICEGEIDEVIRIYAGNEQIQLSLYNIRIYKGSEKQMPDPLIESFEGAGKTPAFRGQAYVVFEDFPLAAFGNHIPNFNFEVRKKASSQSELTSDKLVKSIVIIPGGGEYVYDTVTQYKSIGSTHNKTWCPIGKAKSLNHNTNCGKTNAMLAVDQLQKALPNVEWVSVVVNWFGTSLDIANCQILPGVEYWDNSTRNYPDPWSVAGYDRYNAHKISQTNEKPNYGGTINDASIVRFVQELKARGLKVVLYPMVFMDLPNKPWRGDLGGDYRQVDKFFERYNKFIIHYCTLLKNQVDAIIIGSEFKALTAIQAPDNSFPAVDNLVKLAKLCRSIVGNNTMLTYAADWSEYHHSSGGWYNMDKLWASPDLDFIGIDAYFPLSNSHNSLYDIAGITKGWESGVGYDFYYKDQTRSTTGPLSPEYAWKNIRWWWENYHINPDGSVTDWQPKSKKIWFTEYGFPSVDCCTNQPNVFNDPNSLHATYPIHSNGTADFKAQANAIVATELKWLNSDMVDRKFLWCWDARPYPYWPDLLQMWSDGKAWQKGHWVQGKIGNSTLAGVLEDLSLRAGLSANKVTCSKLNESLDGLVIDSQTSIRDIINMLQKAYQFDVIEKAGQINFSLSTKDVVDINKDDLAMVNDIPLMSTRRTQDIELPQRVDVNYLDIAQNHQISNQHAKHMHTKSRESICLDLPLVLSQASAKMIAQHHIHNIWSSRNHYSFYLPPKYLDIKPGDLLKINYCGKTHVIKVIGISIGKNNLIKVEAISYKEFKKAIENGNDTNQSLSDFTPISATELVILDIPHLAQFGLEESYVLVGTVAKTDNWTGATIFSSSAKGSGYQELAYIDTLATTGHAICKLPPHNPGLIDYKNRILLNLEHGELISVLPYDIARGANLCIIGDEILQFQNARLIGEGQYELSTLYRGLCSTEDAINAHEEGDRFVLIDENLKKVNIPYSERRQVKYLKAVSNGHTLGQSQEIEFIYQANCQKPFSPVHLRLRGRHLTWIPRSRLKNSLPDYTGTPLDANLERYLIRLGSKTIQTTQPELTLETSNKMEDIMVCQLNDMGMEGCYILQK